jgi:hypothetical protein
MHRPALIIGDFNAHKKVWGCGVLDAQGKAVEDFVNSNNLTIVNSPNCTYIHPATG